MSVAGVLKDALRPAWRKTKAVRRGASDRLKWAYGRRLAENAPIEPRKVVLSCNFGRGYLCNPKYIAEALERLYPGEFDLVLLVNEHDNGLPSYLRQVRYGSREAQRELASARFWIYNFRNDEKFVPKRDGQVYIQTWHAFISPKRVEGDVADKLDPAYVAAAMRDGAMSDLMFADNDLYEGVYERAFWYSGPVVRCGNPRNRPLVLGDEHARAKAREVLGVPDGLKLCLYAPTFRKDGGMEAYRFDYDALARALGERFGGEYVFAYRLHPNIASLPRPEFLQGHIDASFYPDTQELLAAADALLTDYSSILEDFMLTGRPGFVYAPDIDEYVDDRGFYYSMRDRPFPVARNEGELISNVIGYSEEEHGSAVERFSKLIGLDEDGCGDETVARIIHALTRPGRKVSDVVE